MTGIAEQIAEEDRQQALHRPGKHRVVRQGSTVYVKCADFFESQGGLTASWGRHWVEIEADSIDDARLKGMDTTDRAGAQHD